MYLLLPLPIDFNKKIRISIDGIPIHEFNQTILDYCGGSLCHFFIINDNLINKMKQGNKMTISYYDLSKNATFVDFSLYGFTEALKELD